MSFGEVSLDGERVQERLGHKSLDVRGFLGGSMNGKNKLCHPFLFGIYSFFSTSKETPTSIFLFF